MIRKGIDVSSYQGDINWKLVKNTGIEFAIIRATTATGSDSFFLKNCESAYKEGIDIGAYTCLYGTKQLDTLNTKLNQLDIDLKMGIWLDLEVSQVDNANTIKDIINYATKCFDYFYKSEKMGIYVNKYWYSKYKTQFKDLPLWIASYPNVENKNYPNLKLHQYSSTGKVNGIGGNVDLNYQYSDIGISASENYETCPYEEPTRIFDITNAGPWETLWLKWHLKKLGYNCPVYSVYGENTDLYLRDFQATNGIPDEEIGGVTAKTRELLKKKVREL